MSRLTPGFEVKIELKRQTVDKAGEKMKAMRSEAEGRRAKTRP